MAVQNDNPFALNIAGVEDLIQERTNKVSTPGRDGPEGVAGQYTDELELPMSDEELLKLRDEYEEAYLPYGRKVSNIYKRNYRSYLGRNIEGSAFDQDFPLAANMQFKAEETFLAVATAQNPDPFVFADGTPEGTNLASTVQTMLQFHAQQLLLRRRLATMVRQWSIFQLGVLKVGWNEKINDISLENRKIQDFLFDPSGYVNVYGDFTSWTGERIAITASELCDTYPEHRSYIEKEVDRKLGTKVIYTEWRTDDFCFKTFKNIVLEKYKNEFWNYGNKNRNHFASPKKPYVFLSIFSLEEQPHDITGLIEQNIPNQSKISRRTEELDVALSQSVNGLAFSMNNFNQETAKQASTALTHNEKGKVLIPPGGPIGEAIVRLPAPDVTSSFFDELEVNKQNLLSSWGVEGVISQPQTSETTARGMILNQQRDTSRIGGGINDVVEQSVAKTVYDWFVQLYCIFYDEKHFAAVAGTGKAVEYVELHRGNIDRQLIVGVAPNSMKPKDELTLMNQAQELFKQGLIGPKRILEVLKFPNAEDAAADGILWMTDKKAYVQLNFPELYQQIQQLASQPPQPASPQVPPGQQPANEPVSQQMGGLAGSLPPAPPSTPMPPTPQAPV